MRHLCLLATITLLAACSEGGSIAAPGPTSCSNTDQKQFVVDAMNDWYLWNDLLPANVDINAYASPEEVLAFLTTFSPDDGSGNPIDRFSFINSAEADQQFFGEGRFEGFGFSSRFVAADDLRLTRVFSSSPANAAGLARGQRILELDGRTIAEIQAAEGVNAVFDTTPLTFLMREPGGNEFSVSIDQDIVTIDPVPQFRVIDNNGIPTGYMELSTFISTANSEFDAVFTAFDNAGVNDIIIDMRYNGGGLVSTAELLGDFLGGFVAQNLIFSETRFNDDRAADNNSIERFELQASSANLVRLIIVATRSTASASELVTNGMEPHVEVVIVGDDTFGKPVGQIGLEFCDQILRPTSFQTVNSLGNGDYFDGLPVDCPAADDLNVPVGDALDPNIVTSLAYFSSGACPVTSVPDGQNKVHADEPVPVFDRRGPPSWEYAGAF